MIVREANTNDAKRVAEIHQKELHLGFISTFNISAITLLYRFIIENEIVHVVEEDGKVIGFVAGTVKTSGLFKEFIIKHGIAFILKMLPRFFNPSFIARILETLTSPNKSGEKDSSELPELLTIAVDSNLQAKGAGKLLLDALEGSYKALNVKEYKVVAGGVLESANLFYTKYGFALLKQVELHKGMLSNIYVKRI